MANRVINFYAGPAGLPLPALERAQGYLKLPGTPKKCNNLPISRISVCFGNRVDHLPPYPDPEESFSYCPGEELLGNITYQITKVIYTDNPAL